jgi:hypothetical protein
VSPLDGVNGVRRNLLARIGLSVGCRVSGTGGRSAAPFLSTRLWQFEGLSVKQGPLFEPCLPRAKVTRSNRVGRASFFLFYSTICALGLHHLIVYPVAE